MKIEEAYNGNYSHYAAEKAANGGGYCQPQISGTVEIDGAEVSFDFSDTSCGDFGERYKLSLFRDGEWSAVVRVNQMDDSDIEPEDTPEWAWELVDELRKIDCRHVKPPAKPAVAMPARYAPAETAEVIYEYDDF
jgi:hypothetical protein